MALYVSIDESYSVSKLNSLQAVVDECANFTTQDGRKVTKAIAKKELASGSFNVYDYDEYEIEDAKIKGSVRGVDWELKIQSL